MAGKPTLPPSSVSPKPEWAAWGDSDPAIDISKTLISDRSLTRAAQIYARSQGIDPSDSANLRTLQLQAPPETYVIRYYIADDTYPPAPQLIQTFSSGDDELIEAAKDGKPERRQNYLRPGNEATGVNANMKYAIDTTFAMIKAQLPGRFRFVRVTDPKDADINFAAVPTSKTIAGVTSFGSGSVLLNMQSFQGRYSSFQAQRMLHEVLHALGLEHPHSYQKGSGGPSTDRASYFDTALTYDENDRALSYGTTGEDGYPISMMSADLQALVALYPRAGDRQALPPIGLAAGAGPISTISVDIINRARQAVVFPDMGTAFQPMTDTNHDTLVVRNNFVPKKYSKKNENGVDSAYRTEIYQTPGGLAVTRPYGGGN